MVIFAIFSELVVVDPGDFGGKEQVGFVSPIVVEVDYIRLYVVHNPLQLADFNQPEPVFLTIHASNHLRTCFIQLYPIIVKHA